MVAVGPHRTDNLTASSDSTVTPALGWSWGVPGARTAPLIDGSNYCDAHESSPPATHHRPG